MSDKIWKEKSYNVDFIYIPIAANFTLYHPIRRGRFFCTLYNLRERESKSGITYALEIKRGILVERHNTIILRGKNTRNVAQV